MFSRLRDWFLKWLLIFAVIVFCIGYCLLGMECVGWVAVVLYILFQKQIRAVLERLKQSKSPEAA